MTIANKIKKAIFIFKTNGLKAFICRIIDFVVYKSQVLKAFIYRIVNFIVLSAEKAENKNYPNKFSFKNHAAALNKRYSSPEPLVVAKISNELLHDLKKLIQDSGDESIMSIQKNTKVNNYLLIDSHEDAVIQELENNLIVHAIHSINPMQGPIRRLHNELRDIFKIYIKSPFVFVNTRAWSTKANSSEFGPNSWHTDGFEPGHMKIMVYITPLNDEYGYFMHKSRLNHKIASIKNRPAGTSICFLNSELTHCGVPGNKYPRICIEVTLMRAFIDSPQFNKGAFFGRHLKSPEVIYHETTKIISEHTSGDLDANILVSNSDERPTNISGKKINIGSGVCNWPSWLCFDEIDSVNVTKLKFDKNFIFPVEDKSVYLAYSSHNFEHLPDATIFRVLSELRRVLKYKGLFVLKIPDYDWFLAQYRSGVKHSMIGKGVDNYILNLWSAAQLDNSYENSLSMMFCGYWNKAYGEHFSGISNRDDVTSYHGPAKVSIEQLKSIFSSTSPKVIATKLKEIAMSDPDFKAFNHQNAWSRDELKQVLREQGFRVLSTNTDEICMQFYNEIPDLLSMMEWSSYYLCEQVI